MTKHATFGTLQLPVDLVNVRTKDLVDAIATVEPGSWILYSNGTLLETHRAKVMRNLSDCGLVILVQKRNERQLFQHLALKRRVAAR